MKPILLYPVLILLAVSVFHFSCKKEYSCEGCINGNKPPIADAGSDLSITLPTDSVSLDGRQSSDPDGTISSFQWTKISGPNSPFISSTTSALTVAKNLIAGAYSFELKVTDDDGLSSKDTVKIIVTDPSQPNRPPAAKAGADQTISLPGNTVSLDGSASTDPDNNIITYTWTKISGPSSFTIVNSITVQTQVTNLVQGIYQFELTVTDAGGLSSRDTVQINVNAPVFQRCYQLMPFEHLPSAGGVVHASAAGSKILFVRYTNNGVVDIYDTVTHGWSTVSNMNAVYGNHYTNNAVTMGNKIVYSEPNYAPSSGAFNGQLINIYDASSNTWEVNVLPGGREGYVKAVAGNKIFYAGGRTNDSSIFKKIDVYDATTNAWSTIDFPAARIGMCAIGLGNRIYFAGGYLTRYDSLILACDDYGNNCDSVPAIVATDRIDILDISSNTWSVAHLSEPRGGIATAVVGNKIVFAAGDNNIVNVLKADIYDAGSNSWSSGTMGTMGNSVVCAYSVGNKVLVTYLGSNKVDIYDATNNSWSVAQMPQQLLSSAQERTKGAVLGNKIVFHTIFTGESDSRNIDVYDASTNTWCHELLDKKHIRAGVISYGGRIYVAGGSTMSNCCSYDTLLDTVWYLNL